MTSETRVAHTPGPWRVETETGDLMVLAPDGRIVAYFGDMETTEGPDHRNADLVAAAPELLDAARFVVTCAGESGDCDGGCIEMLGAVIAKAEGRT